MIFIQAVIGGGPELEYLKMKIDDKYIGMTLLAAFLGFWVSKYFIDLTAAQLNLLDLEIINFKNGLFSEYDLMFALTIGLLPLMYLITEKLGKLKSTKQSYLALAIIFISGILMWQFEIFTTKRMADYIATAFSKYNIHNQISIESLKLGKHFAIGCLLGTGLSSFIFRKINKEQTNNFTTIENPNETSKEISFGTKQRHGCVTAWLILLIIFNSLGAVLNFFANKMFVKILPNNPPAFMLYLLGIIGIANVFFAIQMMQWKKYAFWGFAITAVGTLSINLSIGLSISRALGGIVGIVILYGVLQIKKDNITAWENLE